MVTSANFSAPFIRRPVATSLITIAIFLSGWWLFVYFPFLLCLKSIFPQSRSEPVCRAPALKRWRPP